MHMINPAKMPTALAALLALLNAFPANAAAPAPNTTQLAFWMDAIFLILIAGVSISFFIARNRNKGSRYVDGTPADRKIVRTCITILWSCIAVAWIAVVATAVRRPHELADIAAVALSATLIALIWSIHNSWMYRRPMLMIIGVYAVVLLAASLLGLYRAV
jgi:hypothetical protein